MLGENMFAYWDFGNPQLYPENQMTLSNKTLIQSGMQQNICNEKEFKDCES